MWVRSLEQSLKSPMAPRPARRQVSSGAAPARTFKIRLGPLRWPLVRLSQLKREFEERTERCVYGLRNRFAMSRSVRRFGNTLSLGREPGTTDHRVDRLQGLLLAELRYPLDQELQVRLYGTKIDVLGITSRHQGWRSSGISVPDSPAAAKLQLRGAMLLWRSMAM